jgi:hypothetical protein
VGFQARAVLTQTVAAASGDGALRGADDVLETTADAGTARTSANPISLPTCDRPERHVVLDNIWITRITAPQNDRTAGQRPN